MLAIKTSKGTCFFDPLSSLALHFSCVTDRSPSTDADVSIEREAYSLSAGFALGMVTLGKGDNLVELSDLNISDKLFHLMTGKHKRGTLSNRFACRFCAVSVRKKKAC